MRLASRRDGRLLLGQQRALAADVARRVRIAAAGAADVPVRSISLRPGGNGGLAAPMAAARPHDRLRICLDPRAVRGIRRVDRPPRAPARGRIHDRRKAVSAAAGCPRSRLRMPRLRPLWQQRSPEHRRRVFAWPHAHQRRLRRRRNRSRGGSRRRAAADSDLALELRHAVHPVSKRGLREPDRRALRLRQQLPADDARRGAGQRQLRAAGRPHRARRVLHALDVRQRRDPHLSVSPDGARPHHAVGRAGRPRGGVGAGARARRRGPPDPGAQRRAAVDRRAGNRGHSVEPRRQAPLCTLRRGRTRERQAERQEPCAGFAARIVPARPTPAIARSSRR